MYYTMLIALNTGMRIGEILALKREHIDFQKELILVNETKTNISRYVPMNATVKRILKQLMPKNDSYVIPAATKSKSDAFREQLKKLRTDTGIKKFIGFHNLRHTFSTNLQVEGSDITTVKELLGHTSPGTTLGYSHTNMKQKKRAVASQIRHTPRDLKKDD